jgi:serine protease Do
VHFVFVSTFYLHVFFSIGFETSTPGHRVGNLTFTSSARRWRMGLNGPFDFARHPWVRAHVFANLVLFVGLANWLALPVWSQTHTAARFAELGTFSEQEREAAYDDIRADVEYFERKGNVLRRVVKLVRPTVVHIEAEKSSRTGRPNRRSVEEAGSGFIIQLNGKHYVLTNRHVVKDSELAQINIRSADGVRLPATALWSDRGTDIAVMEVNGSELVAARLGDSNTMEIGDFVLAVGSPFGLSHSVTFGIISATGRRDLELGEEGVQYQDFLQTDAAINPGNSGGPLLNLRGEVIGINTAIASSSGGSEGIGFAIPVNMALVVARQLIETRGQVNRAYVGVHLDSQFGLDTARRLGLPRRVGARVTGITPHSPAADARLQVGDVILEFDGTPIHDDNHLINRVGFTPVNQEVDLVVLRDGEQRVIQLKVGNRASFESE